MRPAFRQVFEIPRLATVVLDTEDPALPGVQIFLSPEYQGELCDLDPLGPNRLYLECNTATAVENAKLAAFMEVAYHWDWDGDGVYDADTMINRIEEALTQSRETPLDFRRPNGPYSGLLMRFMPPQPDRHVVFGFGNIKRRFHWYDYLWAVPVLLVFIALLRVQYALVPWTKYSVVSGGIAIASQLGKSWPLVAGVLIGFLVAWRRRRSKRQSLTVSTDSGSLSMHTYGFFSKAAVYEEQAFREGAEHWTLRQCLVSSLMFGLIHLTNLIYPIATILPLTLGGLGLTLYYRRTYKRTPFRRTAVLATAVKHRLYNKVALTAIVISMMLVFGSSLLSLVGLAVFAVPVLRDMLWLYRQRATEEALRASFHSTIHPGISA